MKKSKELDLNSQLHLLVNKCANLEKMYLNLNERLQVLEKLLVKPKV